MIAEIVQEGLRAWWAPALAFAAGVVSFASPCVLPLVPGYLSFITGEQALAASEEEGTSRPGAPALQEGRLPAAAGGRETLTMAPPAAAEAPTAVRRRVIPIALFILGFSVVFTVVGGFAASSVGRWVRSDVGQRAAGVVVLVFGLLMLAYALRVRAPWLYREGRPLLSRVRPGPAAAFPLGMAFAVGWTPCIGPVLGGILTLAAAQGGVRAVLLLLVYSLGLGVPFLLIGLGLGRLMVVMRFFSRHYRVFAGVSGAALLTIGVLLVSGAWTRLVAPLFRWISRFTPPI